MNNLKLVQPFMDQNLVNCLRSIFSSCERIWALTYYDPQILIKLIQNHVHFKYLTLAFIVLRHI